MKRQVFQPGELPEPQHLPGELKLAFGPYTNGDWPYYVIVEVEDAYWEDKEEDADGCTIDKLYVSVSIVSPVAAGPKNRKAALECCGLDISEIERKHRPLAIADALHCYGCKATLFEAYGTDETELVNQAKEEIKKQGILFGFQMDRQQNAIGNTGWDFVAGKIG